MATTAGSATTTAPDVGDLGRIARLSLGNATRLLRARHMAGASGREIIRGYTLVVDRLISTLFAAATLEYFERHPRLRHRCAIIAQGGYGRRELSPASDIDLVFLYPWKSGPYVETVAEKVLYALWDTGLSVGHAARNPRACVRLAERDLTIKTALLDARLICGDRLVYDELRTAMDAEVLRRHTGEFLKAKLQEQAERHRRHGDSVYILQPNVKEGEGGLRDVHTAMWMAKVTFKVRRLRDLVTLGIATGRDLAEFEESQDFIWRVRNALHFLTGKYQDQLRFEYQEEVAAQFHAEDQRSDGATDRFMRRYYLHATTVNRFSQAVIARCLEQTRVLAAGTTLVRTVRPGMQIRAGVLTVTGGRAFRQEPSNLIRVFAEAQRHNVALSSGTRKYVRDNLDLLDDGARRDPETVAAFLDILRYRHRNYETLREMHKLGVLVRLVPEFAGLLCLVRRDLHHVYTVDEHSLRGILELERLREGAYARSCPLLTQVVREEDRPELPLLALLLHDVGKGHGHGHAARGATLARGVAERMRLDPDAAAQLEFLVREHLLMSHLAQRRDIHDDELVADFARRVGEESTLRRLYLITFADMRAVGPEVWNNWRDMLLGELYLRALHLLERDFRVEEERAARIARIKDRLRAAVGSRAARVHVEHFLQAMPDSYFVSTPEDSMPEHVVLLERYRTRAREGTIETADTAETALRHLFEWGHSEFTVCTADRPGLFSTLAGVLTAGGCNVVSARIITSADGVALDVFRVSNGDVTGGDERWSRVRRTLDAVLRGEADVEDLVRNAPRPGPFARGRQGLPAPRTAVVVDNDVSRDYTVLDVYTGDRVGVLFAITRTLFHLGLCIHLAKITTMVEQVLDVFYVTDSAGRKIEDAGRLAAIRSAVVEHLTEGGDGVAAGPPPPA
jgi:[protein-PII] uridylyltransferase